MNKLRTKIALAGLLFAAAGSSAFAQYDPNLANRYPGYAAPNALWLRPFWQTGRPEFGAGSRSRVRAGPSA